MLCLSRWSTGSLTTCRKLLFLLIFAIPLGLQAQQYTGITEGIVKGKEGEPLFGASILWLGTNKGTTSDSTGYFSLPRSVKAGSLVVSYIGYVSDTVKVTGKARVNVVLEADELLDEVEVFAQRNSTEISYLESIKTEIMNEAELLKAACCNLSESFDTNPSVDVSFTDAVTGTRQIQMLGLAGPYTQVMRENMPNIRGLSALYGMTMVPGSWISSIQLNKGTGSVFNGFESIAGQINVELRKPQAADRLYLNVYGNQMGRFEANANLTHRFRKGKWSTALLLHTMQNNTKWDRNDDGFLDNPLTKHYIGLNRWMYTGMDGWRLQFGIKGTYMDNQGGQLNFDPASDAMTTNHWGMELNIRRLDGWFKVGKVYEKMPWKSTALQVSAATHEQDSYFGLNAYDASQQSFYANWVYQSIFSNTNHVFRTGASLQYDRYDEVLNADNYDRTEVVPGAYFEYTYKNTDKFTAVAGIRADYHNIFGAFVTPRLHMRYAISDNTIVRVSGGRGQRTANIISENNALLATSREIIIQGDGSDKPYGLDPEIAWNYGINFTRYFELDYREGIFTLDFYRTDFSNQIVVDMDQNPQQAVFYNLDGRSFSNSFQAQVDYELINRLDLRMAYRWFDVRTTYNGALLEKPLIAAHRAFINLAYGTRKYWKFDLTVNWQGEKRIPYTGSNPEDFQLQERSPDFVVVNSQITKTWLEKLDVYVGVENLLNFTQDNPILSSDDPFGPYFDSSLIWGPIFGRNIYAGMRFKIK